MNVTDHMPLSERSIILSGASVRSLAAAAIDLGLIPICLDFFGDADLLHTLQAAGGRFLSRLNDFSELPQLCALVDPAVPILCGGGIENSPEVLTALLRQRPVLNAPVAAINAVRNVISLFEVLRRRGIAVPLIAPVDARDESRRWLVKPQRSSGGQGISFLPPDGNVVLLPQQIVQEFINGVPLSVLCIAARAQPVRMLGVGVQCVGWSSLNAAGFQHCGTLGQMRVTESVRQQLQFIAESIGEHSGMIGAFGIDFVLRDGRVWVIEVNPRLTSTHTVHASQVVSPLREHLAAIMETAAELASRWPFVSPEKPIPRPRVSAELVLYARHDWQNVGSDSIPADYRVNAAPPRRPARRPVLIADIPCPGSTVSAGTPLCTLLVRPHDIDDLPTVLSRMDLPARLRSHLEPQQVADEADRLIRQLRASSTYCDTPKSPADESHQNFADA